MRGLVSSLDGVGQEETEPSALSSWEGTHFSSLNSEPQGLGAALLGLLRPPSDSFLPAGPHSQAPRIITFPPHPPSSRPNLLTPYPPTHPCPFLCVFVVPWPAPRSHKTLGLA